MEATEQQISPFIRYMDAPERLVHFADAYRTQVQQLCALVDKTPGLPQSFVDEVGRIIEQPSSSFSPSSPSRPSSRN